MSTNIEVRNTLTWALTIYNYTGVGYTHNQIVASASWVVTHNLWYHPNVQIEDSAWDSVMPQKITQNSTNQMTIDFQGSMSGKAYLS